MEIGEGHLPFFHVRVRQELAKGGHGWLPHIAEGGRCPSAVFFLFKQLRQGGYGLHSERSSARKKGLSSLSSNLAVRIIQRSQQGGDRGSDIRPETTPQRLQGPD